MRATYDKRSKRYVNDVEKAEIERLALIYFGLAVDTLPPLEATSARCMRDLEPLWAVCPDTDATSCATQCWRAEMRERAVLRAHLEVMKMRGR